MVDISDVFVIEGGQVSVEGFAFAPFFSCCFFLQPSTPYTCAKMKC